MKTFWKQKRVLIHMGIPLPVIYVFEDENGYKQVVDGRQRISTIISFMNNEFKLEKLKMLPSFNGKKFGESTKLLEQLSESNIINKNNGIQPGNQISGLQKRIQEKMYATIYKN